MLTLCTSLQTDYHSRVNYGRGKRLMFAHDCLSKRNFSFCRNVVSDEAQWSQINQSSWINRLSVNWLCSSPADLAASSSDECQSACLSVRTVCKKVACIRLPSVGFRSWSRFLAVSLQVTWIINPAVGCHYFLPGQQLPPQPLRGLLPISLLGKQRQDGCEQFARDCYLTASWLRFEPGPSAPESSKLTTCLSSHCVYICVRLSVCYWSITC